MNLSTAAVNSKADAIAALDRAWPQIVSETRQVLAGELHYQAMVYFALRYSGGVPLRQLGMNVKQWIPDVSSDLFRTLALKKATAFQGGFEPIPDVVVFSPEAAGNWQRRSYDTTLRHMRLAVEVKASERHKNRLQRKEVVFDIHKLAAHLEEVRRRGGDFHPVMMIIDVAPTEPERMSGDALGAAREEARRLSVAFYYVSPHEQFIDRSC